MTRVTPLVKWAGGKGQLLSQFEAYWPSSFGGYIEPFVGGGAVFFHLHSRGLLDGKRVVLIDQLEELINCYGVVQNQVEELIVELRRHEPYKTDADYYYALRAWDRQSDYALRSDVARAARFIFLNRTCYNGLYRVNRRGEFNVPFGRYRNPKVCDVQNLRAASQALQGVHLVAGDFERCLAFATEGDLVYMDPPYHPLSATANFTSYTAAGFGAEDQERLARVYKALDERSCQLMLSNSPTPFVQGLYESYERVEVQASRPISSKAEGRGAIAELLVTNGYRRA